MHPATLRRLLVFGVCLVGVGCLYLVPSMAQRPHRVGSAPVEQAQPSGSPGTTSIVATGTPGPSSLTVRPASPEDQPTTIVARATRAGATAAQPGRDENSPSAVGRLSLVDSSPRRLMISWSGATDDVGVTGYQVWLNGFIVLVTSETRATLTWFNDTDTHVVQVRALDAAGNEGPLSPTLLVTRPAPTQPPTPTTNTNVAASSAIPTESSGTEEDRS